MESSKRTTSVHQIDDEDKDITEHSHIDSLPHRHSFGDFEDSSGERERLLPQPKRYTTATQFPQVSRDKQRPFLHPISADMQSTSAAKHKGGTRTTKNNPKLVLFPSDVVEEGHPNIYAASLSEQAASSTVLLDESTFLPSTKDTMPPTRATLKRVTAYCVAESYNLELLKEYLDRKPSGYGIKTKRYDEVLYTPYLPFDIGTNKRVGLPKGSDDEPRALDRAHISGSDNTSIVPSIHPDSLTVDPSESGAVSNVSSQPPCLLFFDYGVVVSWGLTESEEKSLISEVSPFSRERLPEEDIETEALQYCHDVNSTARVFGDIIILKQETMHVKLTIGHALAQSVKLSVFEELLEEAICSAQPIPKLLAATGRVSLSHSQINKKIGRLFILRMHINLVSNVLDTPEIFWAQRQWEPLYKAARSYLEISQRVDVLNQRMSVISDFLDMLKEHLTSLQGEYLEWIVIILVAIEVVIGVIEIYIMINSSVFHGPTLYQ